MKKWATIQQVADHIQMSTRSIYTHIASQTELGKCFHKVAETSWRADLDEVDALLKGVSK